MLQLARKSGKTANLSGVTPTAAVTGIIGPGNTIILTGTVKRTSDMPIILDIAVTSQKK